MNNTLKKLLFVFQLEGYDVGRFRRWLVFHKKEEIFEKKKQLIWTPKARLIYYLALPFHIIILFQSPEGALIVAAYIISFPEWLIKLFIISLAKLKISLRPDLIVIGITGSYGKTSTKEFLAHILSAKYKVLKTPESYNTPIGISRVVLNRLNSSHQVFIVEMGAYQKNDIKILCDIVKPKIGIITAIGKQHLERFGNLQEIIETKFELVSSLPSGGVAFLNGDDEKIALESKKYSNMQIKFFGVLEKKFEKNSNRFLLSVSGIEASPTGTIFYLSPTDDGGGVVTISTPLLGKHSVLNILAAASVAYHLGMSLEEIAKQCATLSPIPHRLQLIKGASGTTIIDDSFNANPASVKAVLDVLNNFPATRKIIVTPGMVELGEDQYKENEIMGEEMARVADYIVVVGQTNRKALMNGIKKVSSIKYQVSSTCVDTLDEATKKLAEIVIPGSVILFENDLPDQYR